MLAWEAAASTLDERGLMLPPVCLHSTADVLLTDAYGASIMEVVVDRD